MLSQCNNNCHGIISVGVIALECLTVVDIAMHL